MAKKKILLLSDDLRMSYGVGTMSKEIVYGTVHKYDWVQVGGAIKHPEEGNVADISKEVTEDQMYKLELDSFMKLVENKKTQERIVHTLKTGKPLIN